MAFAENPLFINTILLGGTPRQKLKAAHDAGFDQIELWQQDVAAADSDCDGLRRLLTDLPLQLTDYQVLLDFDGAPDPLRQQKYDEAQTMIETAVRVGATTLLVPASTDSRCQFERVEEDLGWLAERARHHGLRIAYEAMAWSSKINTTRDAWRLINGIGAPNLGLVVDAFHIFVRQRDIADLGDIPAEKIFLVQLSDLAKLPENGKLVETARHHRLLPGEGNFPLTSLLDHLHAIDYRGPLGLEVFNDSLQHAEPADTARKAMRALRQQLASI
ncbi:sugar phosphate isomerase/epimerase [Erwinia sp. JUb26]|uniref:sugar phosphate isomerase/epimerase family protein n=1 Tax=Erwinia sp. JUb26 TaxID=2485126 RepID=UPI000F478459|nr:sugar phosphate isomerase/epimerase family protein [Erwinia sp. JUb26]ROR14767.1 4-hydroxyphenylpyruvate dioxygenase [Erwinia sp. JUb26]